MSHTKNLLPAVILDRDGTINHDKGYIGAPEDIVLIDGAAEAIKKLNTIGIPVIVITNQSGLARGFYKEADLRAVNKRLDDLLETEGAHIDGLYYCPHHPDDDCECRKPRLGLITEAAQEHNIDLAQSVMVGDKLSDMELAHRAGMRSVLVLTGYGPVALEELKQGAGGMAEEEGAGRGLLDLDFVATDLSEAVEWMLSEDGPFSNFSEK